MRLCLGAWAVVACSSAVDLDPRTAGELQSAGFTLGDDFTLERGLAQKNPPPLGDYTPIWARWTDEQGAMQRRLAYQTWDFNHDGRTDMVEVLAADGRVLRRICDFDFDGKIDWTWEPAAGEQAMPLPPLPLAQLARPEPRVPATAEAVDEEQAHTGANAPQAPEPSWSERIGNMLFFWQSDEPAADEDAAPATSTAAAATTERTPAPNSAVAAKENTDDEEGPSWSEKLFSALMFWRSEEPAGAADVATPAGDAEAASVAVRE